MLTKLAFLVLRSVEHESENAKKIAETYSGLKSRKTSNYPGKINLIIYPINKTNNLTRILLWEVEVENFEYFIDANNGNIIEKYNTIIIG